MTNIPVDPRYLRQIRVPTFGKKNQEFLGKASVLVVGAGALGNPALMYLSAAGVGRIGIFVTNKSSRSKSFHNIISVGNS